MELKIESPLFEEAREKINQGLTLLLIEMKKQNLSVGTLNTKIKVELTEEVTNEGEVVEIPVFDTTVSWKVQKGNTDGCYSTGRINLKWNEHKQMFETENIIERTLID